MLSSAFLLPDLYSLRMGLLSVDSQASYPIRFSRLQDYASFNIIVVCISLVRCSSNTCHQIVSHTFHSVVHVLERGGHGGILTGGLSWMIMNG
jgi:hypothetical protein